MRFVDTNVLLYAAFEDAGKTARARELLRAQDLVLSVQVIQEFYTQAVRPSRQVRLQAEQAWMLVDVWMAKFPVQSSTPTLCRQAWATSQRFQISYWDAAILEAAREAGCDTVLSEDLNHGQSYGGVRVMNPFL